MSIFQAPMFYEQKLGMEGRCILTWNFLWAFYTSCFKGWLHIRTLLFFWFLKFVKGVNNFINLHESVSMYLIGLQKNLCQQHWPRTPDTVSIWWVNVLDVNNLIWSHIIIDKDSSFSQKSQTQFGSPCHSTLSRSNTWNTVSFDLATY